jgi:hypothetical protein
MTKKNDLGFGKVVTIIGPPDKDYCLISNLWGDWWIACLDTDTGDAVTLYLVKYKITDGVWI